jgi:hypothetical protein
MKIMFKQLFSSMSHFSFKSDFRSCEKSKRVNNKKIEVEREKSNPRKKLQKQHLHNFSIKWE